MRSSWATGILTTNNPANNLPVDENTRFRIASISKVFTAVGFLKLVEQGKADLDTDVSQYLGFQLRNPNYPDVKITARMLLSHYLVAPGTEASTRSARNTALRNSSRQMVPIIIKASISPPAPSTEDMRDQAPGVFFHYSNLNFGVLGTIIEKLSGQRYDVYMKENVLEPLGIDASYNVGDFDKDLIKNVSVLYKKSDDSDAWNTKGPWNAKIDDYRGVVQDPGLHAGHQPRPGGEETSWSAMKDYKVGTNATFFSPQGGLRITAKELSNDDADVHERRDDQWKTNP